MKEAAGEANLTVITIVLIAIVLAVGTVVVNGVVKNAKRRSCCAAVGGELVSKGCKYPSGTTYTEADSTSQYAICLKGE